ncbi:hypothetical protein TNCV_4637591 [Trichonephila clavipes]|nr:hypothetical protein TNCV_4637591 [Trichonephila clavipes]
MGVAVTATPFADVVSSFKLLLTGTPAFKSHRGSSPLVFEVWLPPKLLSSLFEEGKKTDVEGNTEDSRRSKRSSSPC